MSNFHDHKASHSRLQCRAQRDLLKRARDLLAIAIENPDRERKATDAVYVTWLALMGETIEKIDHELRSK